MNMNLKKAQKELFEKYGMKLFVRGNSFTGDLRLESNPVDFVEDENFIRSTTGVRYDREANAYVVEDIEDNYLIDDHGVAIFDSTTGGECLLSEIL